MHPAEMGAALVRRLREDHVRFCFHTEVLRTGAETATSHGTIQASVTIIAAGAWTPLVTRVLGWTPPIKPMRGQLLATPPQPPLLCHTIVGRHYHYWQLTEGHIAGSGTVEDVGFQRGAAPADLARIREEMGALFPRLRTVPTARAWYGFRPYCEDLKPVGRVPGEERVLVAAGHFKKGIICRSDPWIRPVFPQA